MGLWIAIFITVALLGSVMWVMPSPRERALTEIRNSALEKGLRVRLVDQKLASSLFYWLDNYRGYVLYEKRLPANIKFKRHKAQVTRLSEDLSAHELDGVDETKKAFERLGLLASLPDSAEALVMSSSGISLLWKEERDVADVLGVDECLSRCLEERTLWEDG